MEGGLGYRQGDLILKCFSCWQFMMCMPVPTSRAVESSEAFLKSHAFVQETLQARVLSLVDEDESNRTALYMIRMSHMSLVQSLNPKPLFIEPPQDDVG